MRHLTIFIKHRYVFKKNEIDIIISVNVIKVQNIELYAVVKGE